MDHSVSCAQGQWCGLQWEVAMWATLLKGIIWPRSYGYTTPVNHRGAFKDPFHRRLLGGKARDEWISALLWVGGLDRRHSVCVRVCVLLCGCSCVCMHLPPSQKDKGLKPDDGTVLSSATHAAFQHCHINGLFFFHAVTPFDKAYLIACVLNSQVWKTAALSLQRWLLTHFERTVTALSSHYYAVCEIGFTKARNTSPLKQM